MEKADEDESGSIGSLIILKGPVRGAYVLNRLIMHENGSVLLSLTRLLGMVYIT